MARLAVGTAAALLALAGLASPAASEAARVLQQAPGGSGATENYYTGDQQLQLVSLAAYPQAVCNDGSPAAFYYSAGSDPNNFVLYLEGGTQHPAASAEAANTPPWRRGLLPSVSPCQP